MKVAWIKKASSNGRKGSKETPGNTGGGDLLLNSSNKTELFTSQTSIKDPFGNRSSGEPPNHTSINPDHQISDSFGSADKDDFLPLTGYFVGKYLSDMQQLIFQIDSMDIWVHATL